MGRIKAAVDKIIFVADGYSDHDQATNNAPKAVPTGSSMNSSSSTFVPTATPVRGTSFHGNLPNSNAPPAAPSNSSK